MNKEQIKEAIRPIVKEILKERFDWEYYYLRNGTIVFANGKPVNKKWPKFRNATDADDWLEDGNYRANVVGDWKPGVKENKIFEKSDPILSKISQLAKSQNLMGMRKNLEKIFNKKNIDFVMEPVPHFRIKYNGKTIIIVNKKYVDDAEIIVGNIAIGYE